MVRKTLLEETKRLLRERDVTLSEIVSGAKVEKHWLDKFAQGHIKDPGVTKVQRVHDFLSRSSGTAA